MPPQRPGRGYSGPSLPAPRPEPSPTSPTAPTPSRSAPPTRPKTPTRPRRAARYGRHRRPPGPSLTDTDPDSPANDNNPEVKGSAEAGSTVSIYSTSDCSGAPLATGTAAAFPRPGSRSRSPAIRPPTSGRPPPTPPATLGVLDAPGLHRGLDRPGAARPHRHRPRLARPTTTTPRSRARADAGSTVRIYSTAGCTARRSPPAPPPPSASPGITTPVADDRPPTFGHGHRRRRQRLGLLAALAYTEDSSRPRAPEPHRHRPRLPGQRQQPRDQGHGRGRLDGHGSTRPRTAPARRLRSAPRELSSPGSRPRSPPIRPPASARRPGSGRQRSGCSSPIAHRRTRRLQRPSSPTPHCPSRRKRKVKFEFTSTEAQSTLPCRFDKATMKPCKPPLTKRVERGTHVFASTRSIAVETPMRPRRR